MRKTSFAIGMLLVAALAGAVVAVAVAGFPWRGELTRRASAEFLYGRLPMLACRERMAFSTDPGMTCDGLARDSARGAELFVRGGRVQSIRRVWWRPAESGRAFVDSLVRAIATRNGGRPHCASLRSPDVPAYDSIVVVWPAGARGGVTTELRAFSGVPHSRLGPEGWVVSVREHLDPAPCADPWYSTGIIEPPGNAQR